MVQQHLTKWEAVLKRGGFEEVNGDFTHRRIPGLEIRFTYPDDIAICLRVGAPDAKPLPTLFYNINTLTTGLSMFCEWIERNDRNIETREALKQMDLLGILEK